MKTARVRSARSLRAATRPAESGIEFKAFIAYDDVAAARDAMSVINGVLQAAPRPHRLRPMLWRCAQVEDAHWSATALQEAATADVVVLAFAARGPLSPSLEAWIARLLARKSGSRLTVVALLGHDDAWTISIEVPAMRLAQSARARVASLPGPATRAA